MPSSRGRCNHDLLVHHRRNDGRRARFGEPLLVLLVLLPGLLLAFASAILSLFRPAGMKTALKLLWRFKIQVALMVAVMIGIVYGAS